MHVKQTITYLMWLVFVIVILQCILVTIQINFTKNFQNRMSNRESKTIVIFSKEKDNVEQSLENDNDELENGIINLIDEYLPKDYVLNRTSILESNFNLSKEECFECKSFNFRTHVNTQNCVYMPNNELRLMLLIMSQPSNVRKRHTIRMTYLSQIKHSVPISYAFVLGRSTGNITTNAVRRESDIFRDIVIFDFIDSYDNLTVKSITAFKWAANICEHAQYIMKVDDDVWVNIPALLNFTSTKFPIQYIGGYCYTGAKPIRISHHKHFVAEDEFSNDVFPPYCNGPAYIMTMQATADVSIIADYAPFIHIEDVFVGICLQMLNYSVTHIPKFQRYDQIRHPCYYKSDHVYTFHQMPIPMFNTVLQINCKKIKIDVNEKQLLEDQHRNLTNFSARTKCKSCFSFTYPVIIENDVCNNDKTYKRKIDVFILILSSPQHMFHRNSIRQTYLSAFKRQRGMVRYLFVMGKAYDERIDRIILRENHMFKDILKFDFNDNYQNLTLKTLNGFKWLSQNCRNVKYVLKVDDDVWLNIRFFLQNLRLNYYQVRTIGGECRANSRPVRAPSSKYHISYDTYPHFNYPPFCAGPSYLLNYSVIPEIVKVARDVPFFHLEDVYVGMCIHYLGYNVTMLKTFQPYSAYQFTCWFKTAQVLTYHSVSPQFMRQIWSKDCAKSIGGFEQHMGRFRNIKPIRTNGNMRSMNQASWKKNSSPYQQKKRMEDIAIRNKILRL